MGAGEELTNDKKHKAWYFYLARLCNHCSYPACLTACPRTAIYKRPEDGIVLIDQKECRGYRKCVEAHIFVAFLAYRLPVTLRMKLKNAAPGWTPSKVLKSLSAIQLVDVQQPHHRRQ